MMRNEAAPGVEPDPSEPVIYPVEAYISEDYARAERDKLWRKVWLQAGRLEDIPEVGNYLTYDILDDSVLIVRTAPDTIKAYFNVCTHRGRRLIDTPAGARNARGKKMSFVCGFHAWTFNLEGRCTHILQKEDWKGALTDSAYAAGRGSPRYLGRLDLDQSRSPMRPAARLSRARRRHARSLRASAHALPMAQVDHLRLQLEGRAGGVQRDLPCSGDAPGVHAVWKFRRLGEDAGKAQQLGLRRTQGVRGEQGQAAAGRGQRSAQVDGGDAGLYLGTCEHQYHQDSRRCIAPTGR